MPGTVPRQDSHVTLSQSLSLDSLFYVCETEACRKLNNSLDETYLGECKGK